MSDDVVIVGGGLEGYVAALSAKCADSAAAVRVLTREGRFDTETGLIDVLGYEPGSDDPVADPLAAIEELPDHHRYAELGSGTVREALALFDDVAGDRYAGDGTAKNALLPTATGHVTPATRYPESFATGLASTGEPMRLVGFERIADFDAELAADRLDGRLPYDVAGTTVTTAMAVDEPPVAPGMASLLEAEPARRDHLAETLTSALDTEPRVGVPAVLGYRDAGRIRESLAEALHAKLFEIPVAPPSVPGRRLESLLSDALEARDVAVERGVTVTDADVRDGDVESVTVRPTSGTVDAGESTYEASAFVLATGGVRAGGLTGGYRELTEPAFDCPVSTPTPDDRLVSRDFLGDHPAVRAGVETDNSLRPVGDGGDVLYGNLSAAGGVLRSSNVVAERSAAGLSIATGFEAGRRAVE